MFLIAVAIKANARTKTLRHTIRPDAVTLHTIGTEALKLPVGIDKAKAVAVGEGCYARDGKRVTTQFLHRSDIFANGLRGIEGGDIGLAAMQEIGGVTTIEGLAQVWRKGIATFAQGTTTIFVRIAADDVVEPLAIGCCDILHIADILQTALYLKRGGTCLNQLQQVIALVHILEGEQITVVLHFPTLAVDQ